ncbi:MAG TPA: hypothetical protein VHT91_22580 [Kofleriaceae bacterium]|nr:hypothetical protein [Kofleriaceae bacterium]
MPKVYRAMTPTSSGLPQVAATARSLGVRVPTDVAPDEAGDVHPGRRGMSVAPDVVSLPLHRIPKRLAHLRLGAIGPDTDVVWSHGEGRFLAGRVAAHLALVPDKPEHGVVAPDTKMRLADYEAALAATQPGWRRDEQ